MSEQPTIHRQQTKRVFLLQTTQQRSRLITVRDVMLFPWSVSAAGLTLFTVV